MNQQQQQPRTLPSFSGLSSAVNEARDYEKSRSSTAGLQDVLNPSGNNNHAARRRQHASPTSETAATSAIDVVGGRPVPLSASVPSKTDASGNILVQDTLTPLLDEVDALFERSKEIIADIAAQGKQHDEDVRERPSMCAGVFCNWVPKTCAWRATVEKQEESRCRLGLMHIPHPPSEARRVSYFPSLLRLP